MSGRVRLREDCLLHRGWIVRDGRAIDVNRNKAVIGNGYELV